MTRYRHAGFRCATNIIQTSWVGDYLSRPNRQQSWLFGCRRPNSQGIGYGTGYEEDWRIALHEACYQIKLMERNGLMQFDETFTGETK